PTDRMVLLAGVEAQVQVQGQTHPLSANRYSGAVHPQGHLLLEEFRWGDWVEWIHHTGPTRIARRVGMVSGKNTVTIEYENLGTIPVHLELTPLVCHKDYHGNFRSSLDYPEHLSRGPEQTVVEAEGIRLFLTHSGFQATIHEGWYYRFHHLREEERGLDPVDDLYAPVILDSVLGPGEKLRLTASDREEAVGFDFCGLLPAPPDDLETRLVRAARVFDIETPLRTSILAGLPWFTDWGRDTMIALPGLCLETGRWDAAAAILRAYGRQMRHGLIPNRFVDDGSEPDTNTVDATLWYANAVYATLQAHWDEELAEEMLIRLTDAFQHHVRGTLFGIQADPTDGLLRQGEAGVQLTWMDVKIGDWVVTPRHGKPIEIAGLWVNFLRVLEWLGAKLDRPQIKAVELARRAEACFEEVFWRDSLGHYLDVADPDDGTLRPNQIIAMSLPFSPMSGRRAEKALDTVRTELLTPKGLRTMARHEMGYRGRFEGSMTSRDSAYHMGTVWPWLLGPYVSACLRLGRLAAAEEAIGYFAEMLDEAGLEGISEVYDGDPPQRPGGCPWQAWSLGEALRALREVSRARASMPVD
ncbi:MAG: amylo-alpha-1,6-glucosidase, partial [Fimbriimonadaceae bacterium]|nr:amylo-alpha-1,6-glucosidase [Fimbriimonadaceae bacterium]